MSRPRQAPKSPGGPPALSQAAPIHRSHGQRSLEHRSLPSGRREQKNGYPLEPGKNERHQRWQDEDLPADHQPAPRGVRALPE